MYDLANRVSVNVATTGTGAVTPGTAVSSDFLTTSEAGLVNGRSYTWLLTENGNFQLFRGAYSTSGPSVSRDSTLLSKISGTVGAANLSLSGGAVLSIVPPAQDFGLWGAAPEITADTVDATLSILDTGNVRVANKATAITFNLPALASAGHGPYLIRNIGAGDLTIDPNGSETIEGAAGGVLKTGDFAIVWPNQAANGWRAAVIRAKMASGDFRANTAGRLLTTDGVWGDAALVTLTDAATVTVDMSTFLNTLQLTLGGSRTLGNPSNVKVGQSFSLYVVQPSSGGPWTLSYASNYKFYNGVAPVLSTAANAVDRLVGFCRTSTHIDLDISKNRS